MLTFMVVVDFAASVKELDGTGVVLHDFDGADEQELTVFAEQQVCKRFPTIVREWLLVSKCTPLTV